MLYYCDLIDLSHLIKILAKLKNNSKTIDVDKTF